MKDEEGYLYFINRNDEMIKTSGYRVSPTEIEDIIHGTGLVTEAVAVGLPHAALGQAILLVVTPSLVAKGDDILKNAVLSRCRRELPNFMVPTLVSVQDTLPHNANGKIDRRRLFEQYQTMFQDDSS
jgi:acyl-coenzyme A synthetase/AMP-(fatty) acid ligase